MKPDNVGIDECVINNESSVGNEVTPICSSDPVDVEDITVRNPTISTGVDVITNSDDNEVTPIHSANPDEVNDTIHPNVVSIGVATESISKCRGYLPSLTGSVFEHIPFHQLDQTEIVFEGAKFHAMPCMQNHYDDVW